MVLIRVRIGNKPERAIDKQFVNHKSSVCVLSEGFTVTPHLCLSLRLQSGTSLTPSFIYRLWWKTLDMEGEVFVVHLLRCCSFNATDSYQQHPLWAYQAIQHKCRFSEHCGGFPQVSFTSWCFPSRWNNNNINNNKNVIREKHWSFVFDHSLFFPSHLKLCVFHPLAVHLLVGFTHQKWWDCKVTTFISACHWWHKILWRRLEWLLIFSYYVSKEQDSSPPQVMSSNNSPVLRSSFKFFFGKWKTGCHS